MTILLMNKKSLIQIVIDTQNYEKLKNLGRTGESFNDVITKLIEVYLSYFDSHKTICNPK